MECNLVRKGKNCFKETRKQKTNLHHVSGPLVITYLHVTLCHQAEDQWRECNMKACWKMLRHGKNESSIFPIWRGRKNQHHSPPGKEKEILSPTSLALLWVSDWTKWPPLVSQSRVSAANTFLVKLSNYAFKPVFCWYYSSFGFIVFGVYLNFYPQRKVSLPFFCRNTFWHRVATWKYIVNMKIGYCLNIFVTSLGISQVELSLTGISSFLNEMKKFLLNNNKCTAITVL